MAPVANPYQEAPLTARMSGSAMAPVANPYQDAAFTARLSGSAMAPVASQDSATVPPCVVAAPVLLSYPTPLGSAVGHPQHVGSQATLAVDDSQDYNQSAENVNPQIPSGAASGAFSPRDSVWKRYFNPPIAGADTQSPSTQPRSLHAQSDKQLPSAIGMVCGISRNSRPQPDSSKSPSGIPRLPLQAAGGPQLCTPEGVAFDSLPATERSRSTGLSSVPPWCSVPQVPGDVAACHVEVALPSAPVQATGGAAQSYMEQVRLSEAHYSVHASPRGSTATLPPDGNGKAVQDDSLAGKPRFGPTLQQTMGHFGAPEPPQSVDIATLQNLPASQGSVRDCSMSRDVSCLPSPVPDSSILPDEYGLHSFVVATSPFVQSQGQDVTSFVQPSSDVQPLQPRRRGLPGNTIIEDQDKMGGQESSLKKSARTKAPPAEAEPLDDIGAAAAAISLRDLAELRSFRNPPTAVCQVLEPVAVLLDVPHKPWARMRKLLDGTLLSRLNSFDPDLVTPAHAERVKSLLRAPAFSDGSLHEKCPAAVGLSHWCRAVVQSLSVVSLPASRKKLPATDAPPAALANRPDLSGLTVEPDLWAMSEAELARVKGLQFSRDGVGSVYFHGEVDVRDVLHNLVEIVLLHPGEVVVYPNPSTKPPVGVGLNKAADITLFGCMPKTHNFRDSKAKERYKRRVKQMTEDKGAEFVDYDCMHGIWKFRVNHF